MSVSRCFDELEHLNIDVLGMKENQGVISAPNNTKVFLAAKCKGI